MLNSRRSSTIPGIRSLFICTGRSRASLAMSAALCHVRWSTSYRDGTAMAWLDGRFATGDGWVTSQHPNVGNNGTFALQALYRRTIIHEKENARDTTRPCSSRWVEEASHSQAQLPESGHFPSGGACRQRDTLCYPVDQPCLRILDMNNHELHIAIC